LLAASAAGMRYPVAQSTRITRWATIERRLTTASGDVYHVR
jgi:hypothetical protein